MELDKGGSLHFAWMERRKEPAKERKKALLL
jgi:hypothetical protein